MNAGVICIDPPWRYSQFRDSANGAAISAMEVMTLDEIAAVPVGSWKAPNCVLALWITGTKLVEGAHNRLFEAWGFENPKTIVPWLKNSPTSQDLATGVGIWFQGNAEYMVFATHGDVGGFFTVEDGEHKRLREAPLGALVGPREDPTFWKRVSERTLIAPKAKSRRGEKNHSKKPEKMREYLETFPGPYLELFARNQRPGWTAWGKSLGQELGSWGVRGAARLVEF